MKVFCRLFAIANMNALTPGKKFITKIELIGNFYPHTRLFGLQYQGRK